MSEVWSVDPRTGRAVELVARETSPQQVDLLATSALAASLDLEAIGRVGRARILRAMAQALEGRRDEVVGLADRETALGQPRLQGELGRTCYQLRLFADVLDEGSYLEAMVDHAGPTTMGPRPDLRRMLVPLGAVAVFGAGNFPLAFSVPGGDTASAIAAGCPVVVKAHHSHPATSALCLEVLATAATAHDAPQGTLSLVHGLDAGAALVAHPAIEAVGFTGSLSGGQALLRVIEGRARPIPFFGEMSSLNPVVVTPQAARERAAELGQELVGSFTLCAGQFCTKPGLILVPQGPDGDAVVESMARTIEQLDPQVLLNAGIAASYARGTERLAAMAGTEIVAHGREGGGPGFLGVPSLLSMPAANLRGEATEECFGPVTVVARWSDEVELADALRSAPASLTGTVLRGKGESELPGRLHRLMRGRVGRVVFDSYPTGVAVSWAQQHGGPWPSTNAQHTSVGPTAIRRFLRPVSWQNAPEELLPRELRDPTRDVPRRVDGVLMHAAVPAEIAPGR